jgi:hypothetical protein
MVLNTSYGLNSTLDFNNGDIYIKSDGLLGPYIDIKHSGLRLYQDNQSKIHNIILQNYNIIVEMPYVNREIEQLKINLTRPQSESVLKEMSKPIIAHIKPKIVINDIGDIEERFYELHKLTKEQLTKEELLEYLHSKYVIEDINDEEIYNNYIRWFNDQEYMKKYLKYKKKYLLLRQSIL